MKGKIAKKPFERYRVYQVFHKKEGRNYACLVPIVEGLKRKTTSWARYMMSIHLGRLLERNEHVDHKNDNPMDDRISNFQILTPGQNMSKSRPKAKSVVLSCGTCGNEFERRKGQEPKAKGYKKSYCSRRCNGLASHFARP